MSRWRSVTLKPDLDKGFGDGKRLRKARRIAVITLTDSAAAKVKELVGAEGNSELALRVAVRAGGCSGFSYEMFFDSEVAPDDQSAEFGGVKVVVDSASVQYLAGASLDYKEGLMGAGF